MTCSKKCPCSWVTTISVKVEIVDLVILVTRFMLMIHYGMAVRVPLVACSCCEFNKPPWFCANLPQPTTDDLELRICRDTSYANEDIIVSLVELNVKQLSGV